MGLSSTISQKTCTPDGRIHRLAHAHCIAEIVRLGIDLAVLRGVNRIETDSPHGDDDRSLTVGRVGRFVEFKDPLFFVEVAGALKASGAHAKFMMAGDGPLQPAVEKRIADLGLRSDFTLAVLQRNMARVYAQIDVMTLTSHNEGTPVAFIESMATGLPFGL